MSTIDRNATAAELYERLINFDEGEQIEAKQGSEIGTSVMETICAFANEPGLGGGVLLTLCHPFDYLRWLVGDIEDIAAIASRRDSLGLAVETAVDAVLQFENGASGHVHVDFVQRPPEHRLSIIGTEGTVTWNQADHAARLFSVATNRWAVVAPPPAFERNAMFLDEMRHFLACLRGEEQPLCTLADGRAALATVESAKRAIRDTAPAGQPS